MNVDDILSSEKGKVLEFKDPFKFFELPEIVQEEFLLKSDINSIKNLCNTAALSKKYNAVNFFEKLCNSYIFWRKKFRQDFPESYEEIPKDLLIKSGINDQASYWIEKYEMELRKLLIASREGNFSDVKRYLELGADPNMQDKNEWTALMRASWKGHTETVKALLELGADPNMQDHHGNTALSIASVIGHTETVKALLYAGADPDLQDNDGMTALVYASYNGHTEIVQDLLDKSADPNIPFDFLGNTALGAASGVGNLEIVRTLLENGAEINNISLTEAAISLYNLYFNGYTLTDPEVINYLNIVELLKEYGASTSILHRIIDIGFSLSSGSLFRDTNDPFLVSDPLIEF